MQNEITALKRIIDRHPKTVKSFLQACLIIANSPTYGLRGSNKLTTDEKEALGVLSVVLQNELSDIPELLAKFNLKYP